MFANHVLLVAIHLFTIPCVFKKSMHLTSQFSCELIVYPPHIFFLLLARLCAPRDSIDVLTILFIERWCRLFPSPTFRGSIGPLTALDFLQLGLLVSEKNS